MPEGVKLSCREDFEDRSELHLIARMPDHALWMTFFRVPDDNLLGLMAEVRPPAAR